MLGVRLPGERKQGKGMGMNELAEMVAGLIAGGDGEIGRERGGKCRMEGL